MTKRQRPTFTGPNRTGTTQVNFIDPIGRRILEVARVDGITPRYRRITLTGDDLAGGFPFVHFAVTDHVKLFFPHPESGDLVMPTIGAHGWAFAEGAGEPIYRDYTVRAFDAEQGELTIDFVVHDHGVAGVWARDAAVGDRIGVLGPRGNVLMPEDIDHYFIAGDETALPALARFIEEAPADSRVTAIIEVADSGEVQSLHGEAAITLHWVHRDSFPVGEGHGSALETAVRGVAVDTNERVFAFAAGEATMLKPIRRYLRRELGLAKERVDIDGYWKRGTANLDHHNNELSDDHED